MTLEDWAAAIDAAPEDWDLKMVSADWAEEHGYEVLGRCWRWQGLNQRRAKLREIDRTYFWILDVRKKNWFWYSEVPFESFQLKNEYKTRLEADLALAECLEKERLQ